MPCWRRWAGQGLPRPSTIRSGNPLSVRGADCATFSKQCRMHWPGTESGSAKPSFTEALICKHQLLVAVSGLVGQNEDTQALESCWHSAVLSQSHHRHSCQPACGMVVTTQSDKSEKTSQSTSKQRRAKRLQSVCIEDSEETSQSIKQEKGKRLQSSLYKVKRKDIAVD